MQEGENATKSWGRLTTFLNFKMKVGDGYQMLRMICCRVSLRMFDIF